MRYLILTIACLIPLSAHANEYTALASRAAAELQAEQAAKALYRDQAATAAQELVAEMQAQRQAEADAKMLALIEAQTKPLHAEIERLRAAMLPVAKEPFPKDERPMVTVYTVENCPPCKRLKDDKDKLPVNPSFQAPTEDVKKWVDEKPNDRGYPVIHYKRGDKWFYHSGYLGVDDFKKWWDADKATGVKPVFPYSSNGYTPHWTWPGNLAQHLRSTHGINTDGMSQDQMEQAHDRSHDGGFRANSAPVQHAFNGVFGRRRGGCPNGMCPR